MAPKRIQLAKAVRTGMGGAAIAGYASHATYHFLQGTPQDALWSCHLAAVLVGVGLIGGSATLNAAGLLCQLIGLPMWLLYLFSGEPFIPTSVLTHVLGPILGIIGARALGFPRSAWLVALGFVAALMIVTRLVTPAEANVNLAFGPMAGLSLWSVGGAAHWALLLIQWSAGLIVLQLILRRIFPEVD